MRSSERQNRRALLGGVLLAAIIATAGVIFFLERIVNAAQGRSELTAVLPEARAVRPGAEVWIAGKEVGRVAAIQFLPRGSSATARVALTLEIPDHYRDLVRAGSRVRVTSDRFIGEPVIDIVPPDGDAPVLPEGDTVFGRLRDTRDAVRRSAFALLAAVNALNADVRALDSGSRDHRDRFARMERGLTGVQAELARLTASAAGSPMLNMLGDTAWTASVERLAGTMRELAAALDSAAAPDRTRVADVRAAFAAMKLRADALALEADRLRAASSDNGLLSRMARDSAIAVAIRGVQAQLDSLIAEARRNPLRFVF
jgi:ABC-type transporter Mla subunit MlaD